MYQFTKCPLNQEGINQFDPIFFVQKPTHVIRKDLHKVNKKFGEMITVFKDFIISQQGCTHLSRRLQETTKELEFNKFETIFRLWIPKRTIIHFYFLKNLYTCLIKLLWTKHTTILSTIKASFKTETPIGILFKHTCHLLLKYAIKFHTLKPI